jgi:hypothetical protein
MGDLTQRIKEWREIIAFNPTSEDPEVEAGRKAEKFLHYIVESNLRTKKYRDAHCFLGKRVPSEVHGHRFEIDLMVLTKKHLHFIEIKNWSGELYSNGQIWTQIKKNGVSIEHPDLTQYNSTKQAAVIEYLSKNGIQLDRSYFSQKVVFMNHNLDIENRIQSNPCVVTPKRLNKYLNSHKGTKLTENIIHSLIEFCLDFEKSKIIIEGLFKAMPKKYYKKACRLLENLGTWDRVGLFGQRILTGDVLKVYHGDQIIDVSELTVGSKIKFFWPRNKFLGLAMALLTRFPLGTMRLNNKIIGVSARDKLKFHPAGQESPVTLPLGSVDWISKG